MKLIIGGAFQGKKEYASQRYHLKLEDWKDGETCKKEELYTAAAVFNFHKLLRRMLQAGENISEIPDILREQYSDIILVTDEVGYGIVPMEREEREWREGCGRVCTVLAAQSEEVIRVCCGIGKKLK